MTEPIIRFIDIVWAAFTVVLAFAELAIACWQARQDAGGELA